MHVGRRRCATMASFAAEHWKTDRRAMRALWIFFLPYDNGWKAKLCTRGLSFAFSVGSVGHWRVSGIRLMVHKVLILILSLSIVFIRIMKLEGLTSRIWVWILLYSVAKEIKMIVSVSFSLCLGFLDWLEILFHALDYVRLMTDDWGNEAKNKKKLNGGPSARVRGKFNSIFPQTIDHKTLMS